MKTYKGGARMMSIDEIPERERPVVKKYIISLFLLFAFLFIILSMLPNIINNVFATITTILLSIAIIVMIFKNAFSLKELCK